MIDPINKNWKPESYDEFRRAALQGKVRLDYRDDQLTCLMDSISGTYIDMDKALLREMCKSEEQYRKIWLECGADILLYEKSEYPDGLQDESYGCVALFVVVLLFSIICFLLVYI